MAAAPRSITPCLRYPNREEDIKMNWSAPYQSDYIRVDPEGRHFQVSRKVYTDKNLFELEKKHLLRKSWLYFAHVSEVQKPNDFITRQLIDSALILTRDRAGEIKAFFNTCPHRGAVICREPAGSRKSFTCPYHGWTFKNSGELQTQNASFGYEENFNESRMFDLMPVPRLEIRGGFIFVNFDADAMPLEDYLGAAGDRIDMIAQHSAVGLEVIGGMQEYYIKANYKLMCENSYDGYHLEATHSSYIEYQQSRLAGASAGRASGFGRGLDNGHACFEIDIMAGRPLAQWLPVWGENARVLINEAKAELIERVGEERGEQIAGIHRNMVIFPNSVMNDQQTIFVRSFIPISVNEMIVRAWPLGPVNEAPELRRIRIEGALSFLGPGGFATPDDIEMLELCQRGYETGGIEWNDVSKGFTPGEDSLSGVDKLMNELQMRAYWTQYDKVMSAVG
jgi:p-cumate 2,3-dioxygenase alpha subunit